MCYMYASNERFEKVGTVKFGNFLHTFCHNLESFLEMARKVEV
jgi:hypothetical protein